MKRIEIVEQVPSDVYYMGSQEFIKKLKDKKEQIQLLSKYDIDDNSIIHYLDHIDKDILIECRNISFDLLNTLLSNKFLSNEDLNLLKPHSSISRLKFVGGLYPPRTTRS